jgi:outer membrane protein assembly factor BamB
VNRIALLACALGTAVCGVAACAAADRAPAPSFAPLFPPVTGTLMTESSPNLIDLDGDSVPDIVFGTGVDRVRPAGRRLQFTGEPAVSGEVVAVSGATNRVLWQVPNPRDAFTTPRFARLNGDAVPDVVMGGREGVLTAFDGRNGAVLWRIVGEDVATTPFPYYFLTPAIVGDVTGDGVPDLVDAYGGNDTRGPKDTRDPGFLVVVSGKDGRVVKAQPVPDSAEAYASPVTYRRKDGSEWVVFGTGGETMPGAAYRAPVASLLDGTFAERVETLVPRGTKGVIAPTTVLDLNGDGEPDLVVSPFDGRLAAIDGATGRPLWQREDRNEETYHSAAVVRLAPDRLGLFVSRGMGAFPRYVGSVHRLFDARDGHELYAFRDPNNPAGAPLAIDLTGDGVDEVVFSSTRFPVAQGGRLHVLHLGSKTVVTHDVNGNFWCTPTIADPRHRGTLELIGLAWLAGPNGESAAHPDLTWQLVRLDLNAKTPAHRTWAGYMGTDADGQYRAARP